MVSASVTCDRWLSAQLFDFVQLLADVHADFTGEFTFLLQLHLLHRSLVVDAKIDSQLLRDNLVVESSTLVRILRVHLLELGLCH